MRYVLYTALFLAGMALGIAGVVSLGIGAVYGGVLLATLGAGMPAIHREYQDARREREKKRRADAHRGSGAATR